MKTLIALLLLLLGVGPVYAQTLTRDTRWSGELRFAESVTVPAGVTLEVAPGTQVRFTAGRLEVAGRLVAEKAQFTGENWDGLTLKGCDAQTRLTEVSVRGAKTGILVQGGSPILDRVTARDNEVGVELRGKSAATVRDGVFRGNRKVGLFVKDDSVARVTGCRFEANGKYGAYIYRARPAAFSANRFNDNPIGLMVAYFGSDPRVEGNRFENNETAIEVDRAAQPELHGNLLQGNRVALFLQRRADPLVTGNRFTDNQVAIKLAYSSYPRITGNDFAGNRLALQLEFQSSTWEREQGAAARAGEVAAVGAFGSGQGAKNVTEDERRPATLDGTIDARGNWWGEAGNLELARGGERGNPTFIHDGRDQPTFVEKGQNYPLDTVVFAPWSATPHVKASLK
ncbi:MAG: right-handed parallel beta-helix repeat-containing protein [Desulfuromonadales bacterium]|nr:right-handed parallel beta-helix repeat-containing protein [Desulfuromonadales bacterium]